jgi:hypothetical protein
MVYAALAKIKKNSPYATLTSGINDVATTIPVSELAYFHDIDVTLIVKGILIWDPAGDPEDAEEITITAASGTSGAGNLTGATRGVNADGTIGAAKSWVTGNRIAVMFTTGTYNQIKDNIAALHTSAEIGVLSLPILKAIIPTNNPATWDQIELSNGVNIPYASLNHSSLQRIIWKESLPDEWDGGNLTFDVRYTSNSTNAGTAKFVLKGKWFADGANLNVAMASLETITDTYQGQYKHHRTAESSAFAPSGSGNDLELELTRDYGTDTLDDPVWVTEINIYYGKTV